MSRELALWSSLGKMLIVPHKFGLEDQYVLVGSIYLQRGLMRIIYKLNYEKYRLIRSQGISAKARKKLI